MRSDPERVMPSTADVPLPSPEDTHAAAAVVAAALPDDAFVAVSGDLGAGKTTFVRSLCGAVGIDPREVTSPTFGLVHEYACSTSRKPRRLVHIDAYRLTGIDDLESLGWDEIVGGGGWILVEWPERIAAALPERRLELKLVVTGPTTRRLQIRSLGGARPSADTLLVDLDRLMRPTSGG